MHTRLSRICDALIEAGWLVVLVVTPLFYNTLTNRVFEPDKIHLLRSIVLLMAVAWAIQIVDGLRAPAESRPALRQAIRTPLVLPTLLLLGAMTLSTALSIVPRISLLGSYVRSQGLYTFLCYVALFFMVLTHLRTHAQVRRLAYAVVVASLPIALYAVIQHYGLDPLPWGGNVRERAAGNLGNAIFLSAYLIMAFFIALERLVATLGTLYAREDPPGAAAYLQVACYLFILLMQGVAILFTQSRGPWLGFAAGLYVFSLVGVWLAGRWAGDHPAAPGWLRRAARPVWLGLVALAVLGIVFVAILNAPAGPLAALRQRPYLARVATMLDTSAGTNAVRVLIWQGVIDMMLRPHPPLQKPEGNADALNAMRPLVGYGPESMWVAFNRFYPPELANYESRNASPDRSHNETFDALARTGIVGAAIQLLLFGSVFYYALHWLGLVRSPARRSLFLALMAGGALLGMLIPVLTDGSLRLAGIGIPAGLIAGVILYVTLDVFLSSRAAPPDTPGAVPANRLLILSVFAAVVAFFVEIHFGIAIAATLSLFWILAAVLVVAGMDWLRDETAPTLALAPAARAQPAAAPKSGKSTPRATQRERNERSERPAAVAAPKVAPYGLLRAFLPFAALVAIATLVLTFDLLVNQGGSDSALRIFWDAFATRIDRTTFTTVRSPAILFMFLLTWVIAGWLALTESSAQAPDARGRPWVLLGVYLAATVGIWLAFGLAQATRMLASGLGGLDVIRRATTHVAFFDLSLLLLAVALAAALRGADPAPRPARTTYGPPLVPLLTGVILGALALFVIVRLNLRPIQADIYYKQGLAYEEAGSWEGATVLYREATRLAPNEDYYHLFLGRALLQLATMTAPGGDAVLPEDVSDLSVNQLLGVVDQGIRSLTRQDLLRATNATLMAARRINPLNTDHSANLGRLYRAWAFGDAVAPDQAPTNQLLRDLVQDSPDRVDMDKLHRSQTYYEEAVALSPQNAQLRNELATVLYILGDNAGALVTLDRSLELDPRYGQTYLLQGDALAAIGDNEAALAAYRLAAARNPGDLNILSAIGVLSAESGQPDAALDVFGQIAESDAAALSAIEGELAALDAQAAAAGGYELLTPAARERRDALLGQQAAYRSQLHFTYRNMALVLRDAKRVDEAIAAAEQALSYANDGQRSGVESLLAQLRDGEAP